MPAWIFITIMVACGISHIIALACVDDRRRGFASVVFQMSLLAIFIVTVLWLVIYSFHDWEYKSKVGVISINDDPSNSVFTEDDTDFFIPVDMTQSLISSIEFEKGKYRVELLIPDIDRTYAGIYPHENSKERSLKVRFLAENEPNR